MPSPDRPEYNPNIIGFTQDQGPVVISLQKAKNRYGHLPSDYKLMPVKQGRQRKKGLNLALGKLITETLKLGDINLKKTVFEFFQNWHRDWKSEFGVRIEPFFNLSNPKIIQNIILECKEKLFAVSGQSLRTYLASTQLIRKDVLNSIADSNLMDSAERILRKKQKNLSSASKQEKMLFSLNRIRAHRILTTIKQIMNCDLAQADYHIIKIYADEISKAFFDLSSYIEFSGIDKLDVIKGQGVEFEYATRDMTYLMLGKETGDCTADKTPFQADRDIENIYWTVFPWILDRNYQILKVYYNGLFVMKAHLLPLYVYHEDMDKIILAIDAVETVRAFRDDIKELGQEYLLEKRKEIFQAVLDKIIHIGNAMGIDDIYAEKFSNTSWVRNHLNELPEIFLHVNNLIKLDELEDVFCLSKTLCKGDAEILPQEIFMEIQMKNTSLLPSVTKKTKAVKSFAVIKGHTGDGIPMKKIIGI